MSLEAMTLATQIATPYIRGTTPKLGRMTLERWATLGEQLVTVGAIEQAPAAEECFHNPE